MNPKIDKATVYETNENGTNLWYLQVCAGHDSKGKRIPQEKCEYIAAVVRDLLEAEFGGGDYIVKGIVL